jgi:hypothetical protein
MCSGWKTSFSHASGMSEGGDVQLEIEDGELGLHNHDDGIKSGYIFSFTIDGVFQPHVEFNIAGFEPVRVVSGVTIHNGSEYRLAVKLIRKLSPGRVG